MDWLYGQPLVEWIEREVGAETIANSKSIGDRWARAIHRWRYGASADFYSVDEFFQTVLGIHTAVSRLPARLFRTGRLPNYKRPQELRDHVVRLAEEGQSPTHLALEYGVSPDSIGKWRKQAKKVAA